MAFLNGIVPLNGNSQQNLLLKAPKRAFKHVSVSPRCLPCKSGISSPCRNGARIVTATSGPLDGVRENGIPDNVSVILLAGGRGKRMKADRPKQFLPLRGKPVIEHSIRLFGHISQVAQIVIVLDPEFRPSIKAVLNDLPCAVTFANPGIERQDSVFSGLSFVPPTASLACIHDAARPLVTEDEVLDVLYDANVYGAAVLGVPSKATIKESADGKFVSRTIPRERLWEIQTPQVIKPDLLRKGFEKVQTENLIVTDDVSIIEQLGMPVKITQGLYSNIKITTPEDMNIAESILHERAKVPPVTTLPVP